MSSEAFRCGQYLCQMSAPPDGWFWIHMGFAAVLFAVAGAIVVGMKLLWDELVFDRPDTTVHTKGKSK